MKGLIEEYGSVILAVLIVGAVLALLCAGIKEQGFLHVLAERFSAMTYGG